MRKIIRYTAMLAAGMVFLGGCTFDERLTAPFKEGVPVNVVLGYEVAGEIPLTRAEQEPEYENAVDNIYVFVFDAGGNRVRTTVNADSDSTLAFFSRTQQDESGIENYHPGDGTGNLTTGSVRFSVPSVQSATIVGIANLTAPGTGTAFEVTKDDMDKITTLDELESFVMYMPNHSVERNALFMMTGYAVDDSGDKSIDIAGTEGGTTELGCSIQLTRVDAKVVVNVTSREGDGTWSNFSFEPKTWRVMRVPAQTYLLPYDEANDKTEEGPWRDGSHWDYSGSDAEYFDSQERPFEQMTDKEVDNTKYYTGGSFVFYMPENRKRFRREITETGDDGYALREESDQKPVQNPKPGQDYANGDFTYADPNSTYLLLTGYLSYTMGDGTVVNTDARYIVHLGYCSGNPNDYDTKRNGKYTYNITVTGADNLIVEVTDREEERPGYEGDVVYSNNQIYYLDSHYDRCLLEIRPSDVTDEMTWSVKTPFTTGVHDVGDETYKDVEDFRWIKFAINKKYDIRHDQYAKYPGDNQYKPEWHPRSADISQAPGLMDIDQLIAYLKLVKAQDADMSSLVADGTNDGHICITAFVDENLYYYDPINDQIQQNPQPQLWHQCVDREDRMMHIIVPDEGLTGGDYYSPDGSSSLVTSVYSFVQKSIRTVFDASNTQLQTAWGLESVMEGEDNGYNGRLLVGDVSAAAGNPDYNSNGRANSISWMVGKRWEDVIKTSERYGLNPGYNNAAYACLLRNRDLDGDGTVDAEEVRWYLAAIDQLTDIFLGEWALDETSRLYPYDPANGDMPPTGKVYWHYTSSSPDPNQSNNPNVLWAEEGASRGNYSSSSARDINGQYYAYRCVRNLGIPLDDPDQEPEDLVQVTDNGDGTYTLDLSSMNPKSLRTAYDNGQPLPGGNEKSANNRPYKKFIVDKDIYGANDPYDRVVTFYNGERGVLVNNKAGSTWSNQGFWQQYQSPNNPCPPDYRVPNQRELLIMSSRLSKDQWPVYRDDDAYSWHYVAFRGWEQYSDPQVAEWQDYYMCQTSFSMNGLSPYYNTLREGFMWIYSSGVFMLQNNRNEVGYVRCVKDAN
ncbi:MAG TPA: DUF4906 domain-containing protein [Candidatus Coprenecus stercoravium]|uniref:DUF4906 domain-containing protein n=1 Tax=Candidatus Coprenecus stercoravium TaxID=2840735 RepID=A0A9D2K9U2_9BACT|nr:DUF4906 domain-containing protein [Candidatus Coprenecus stercoravium]